jgi:hypothetical protein
MSNVVFGSSVLPQTVYHPRHVRSSGPEAFAAFGGFDEKSRNRLHDFVSVLVTDTDGSFLVESTFDLFEGFLSVGPLAVDEVLGDLIENTPSPLAATGCFNEIGCRAAVALTPYVKGDLVFVYGLGTTTLFGFAV